MKALSFACLAGVLLLAACNGKKEVHDTLAAERGTDAASAADAPTGHEVPLERAVTVELYTDFSCPWCYIGVERMAALMSSTTFTKPVTVIHRVYLLDPSLPEEGVNIAENLRAKYGREPSEMFARVEEAAHASGLPLDFSKVERNYPTIRAHALTRAAEQRGTQDAVKLALFRAHFVESKNIYALDTLVDIGAANGFQPEEVHAIVTDEGLLSELRAEASQARGRGVRGVPYFLFNDGASLSGAQPEAALLNAMTRAGQDEATR